MKQGANWRNYIRVGVSLAALYAGSAVAQDIVAPEAETADAANEIIVTAQKRAERLEDGPIAMNAVNEEALERQGVTNVRDLAQITPGANMGRLAVYVQPTIRGVASKVRDARSMAARRASAVTAHSSESRQPMASRFRF